MTGYGKASKEYNGKTILADIKSLNGKTSDIRIKTPNSYRDKEIAIRGIVTEYAHRGKMELSLEVSSDGGDEEYGLNVPLFKKYYSELKELNSILDANEENTLFSAILRIPNVVSNLQRDIDEGEWSAVTETIREAIKELNEFRKVEGDALEVDLRANVSSIMKGLEATAAYEADRVEKIRLRLKKNLDDFLGNENVDQNRFEQEVLFYLEKLDVNEEKVRLSQHCKYFIDVLDSNEIMIGKKLSFISQEIGREINTLGSKAQHSDIQQHVVGMKDALEQIKEQLANVI